MKALLRDLTGLFSPGQTGWHNHVKKCLSLAAELCPSCGNDIFIDETVIDASREKTTYFKCSACEWNSFAYKDH